MSAKAGYEDAELILRLYELRREQKLRAAREWFAGQFFPESIDDLRSLFAPGNPYNAYFRMVVSYWDMAASLAISGPLNAELLLESGGELCLVWAKLERFIGELRETINLPEYLRNIEEIIKRVEWAPDRVRWLQGRIAAARAQVKKQ